MTPLLERGRAGLSLLTFLFVMALLVLLFGRPVVGTAPFVMTVLVLVVSGTIGAVLMLAMRRAVRSRRIPVDPNEGEHHA
ncbi:hypothetical protein ACT3TE_13195 [Brachybacterium sp. AOP42-B2-9]|uniref:hypothetical protein n=1 Tax=Brachybacterium sp. AOP42-B2-9 TaxID=3457672 RepID=UPI0040349D94